MKERILNILTVLSCGLLVCTFCFMKLVMLHYEQEDAQSIETATPATETETEYDIPLEETEEVIYCHDREPTAEEENTFGHYEEAEAETHFDETQIDYEIDGTLYTVTAYCGCAKCCGKTDGITATGTQATEGRTIAVDPSIIPYGTTVYINGQAFVAEDCGGAIKGNHIDMYFNSHDAALEWGVRQCVVSY